jgi:hypothetical protein
MRLAWGGTNVPVAWSYDIARVTDLTTRFGERAPRSIC